MKAPRTRPYTTMWLMPSPLTLKPTSRRPARLRGGLAGRLVVEGVWEGCVGVVSWGSDCMVELIVELMYVFQPICDMQLMN